MDSDMLRQVYSRYGDEIYAYLRGLSGSRSIAEDLCQDTFLKAILSLPDSHTNIRAWLYTVARNLFYNHARKAGWQTGDEPDETIRDRSPGPEETVIRSFRDQQLYRAVRALEGIRREIIVMRYFSGLSGGEVAAILGLSPGNVRVLEHRAKKEMKKYLEDHGYDIS